MHVSFDNRMYICTLSSLAFADYLVLKIVPGRYLLYEYCSGYIMANVNRNKKHLKRNLVKVANVRDGDGGMCGTYHEGGTENRDVLRMLKTYFFDEMDPSIGKRLFVDDIEELSDDEFDDEKYYGEEYDGEEYDGEEYEEEYEDEYEDEVSVLCIPNYNNIPVLFYLKVQLAVADLKNVSLHSMVRRGNAVVWTVRMAGVDACIGYAVLQPHGFHDMMGDQCGVAIHGSLVTSGSANGKVGGKRTARAYAAGNYDVMSWMVLDEIVQPRHVSALTKSIIVSSSSYGKRK